MHEAEVICRNVLGLQRVEGLTLKDFAVFYRTNAQSRVLEDGLRRADIPYQIVGGLRFYDRQEIKDALAYMRLLTNPQDTLSLRRIINVPRRGIGNTTWARLEAWAQEAGISGFEALERIAGGEETAGVGKAALGRLRDFHEFLQVLMAKIPDMTAADVIYEVLDASGYLSQLKADRTVEAQTRLENLSELVNAAADYDGQADEPSLQGFLEHTALVSDQDSLQDDRGAVTLMTLHASKGLEFPVVFIAGMENGLFPHSRSFDEPLEMEEERRLCYVGMTRAERWLFLTSALWRRPLRHGATADAVGVPAGHSHDVHHQSLTTAGSPRLRGAPSRTAAAGNAAPYAAAVRPGGEPGRWRRCPARPIRPRRRPEVRGGGGCHETDDPLQRPRLQEDHAEIRQHAGAVRECRQSVQPPNPPCQGGFWRTVLVARGFRPIPPDKGGFWRAVLVTRGFRPIPPDKGGKGGCPLRPMRSH